MYISGDTNGIVFDVPDYLDSGKGFIHKSSTIGRSFPPTRTVKGKWAAHNEHEVIFTVVWKITCRERWPGGQMVSLTHFALVLKNV